MVLMPAKVSLESIAFAYGDQQVFQGVSLEVAGGEVVCILGANGCGKTTLLRCISGALKVSSGTVRLDGEDIRSLGAMGVARRLGIVFQEHVAPFPYPVLEVVRMGRAPHMGLLSRPSARDTEVAEKALEMVGMLHLRKKPYTQISGGERQLVMIARTLCQEPQVILMDEPTSHLDFKNQALILTMVKRLARQGISVIMSTHMPNHALLVSSRVALMSHGRFTAVGDAQTVVTEDNLRSTYGMDVRILSALDGANQKAYSFCVPMLDAE